MSIWSEYNFRDIEEFNEQFNVDITPIKNCYYLRETEKIISQYKDIGEGYIFGFKLESREYQKKNNIEYFAYPEYNLSYRNLCLADLGPGGLFDVVGSTCYDKNWGSFETTTSIPCR